MVLVTLRGWVFRAGVSCGCVGLQHVWDSTRNIRVCGRQFIDRQSTHQANAPDRDTLGKLRRWPGLGEVFHAWLLRRNDRILEE